MRKKRIILIASFCVAIVLLFAVYFIIDQMKGEWEEEKSLSTAPVQLFNFDTDSVFKMTIDNDEGNFTFEFENSLWKMTEGGDFEINSYVISTILNYMSSLQSESTVTTTPKNLAAYGFDNPVEISCYLEDSTVMTLVVGSATPTGEAFYVKLPQSDTIYTVDYSYGGIFCASKDTLKNTYILDTYSSYVDYLYLEEDGKVIWDVSKDSEGSWSITKPIIYEVMASNVNAYLDDLVRVNVSSFVEENPENLEIYGLDNPTYRLKMHATDNNGEEISCDVIFGKMTLDRDDATDIYGMFVDTKQVFTVSKSDMVILGCTTSDILYPYIHYEDVEDINHIYVKTQTFEADLGIDYENEHYTFNDIVIEDLGDTVLSEYRNFYTSMTQLCMESVDVEAQPEGEAEISILYTRNSDPTEVLIELIPSKTESNIYYVMEDGEYKGFTVRQRTLELTNGLFTRYDNLLLAIDKAD